MIAVEETPRKKNNGEYQLCHIGPPQNYLS